MTHAYVSLGSNMGDAPANLRAAREALRCVRADGVGATVSAVSSVYRTEPQEHKDQPWFHNQVLRLDCDPGMTPEGLLEALLETETRLGRRRPPKAPPETATAEDAALRYGPRVIDIDLLLFGGEIRPDISRDTPGARLVLPHPRMAARAFVLVPLHEIAPGLILPDGRSVEGLLRSLPYRHDMGAEGGLIFQ